VLRRRHTGTAPTVAWVIECGRMDTRSEQGSIEQSSIGEETSPGRLLKVGISSIVISDDPRAVLVSYSLGSCIAVIVHDPVHAIGGMLQFMLPNASASPAKSKERPAMFGDSGIPLLFERLEQKGCKQEQLIVKVAGGGSLCRSPGAFDLGTRNQEIVREVMKQQGVLIVAEDLGGTKSRTVHLAIDTGRVTVSARGMETEL
jgi:chemotaxis protein CheD